MQDSDTTNAFKTDGNVAFYDGSRNKWDAFFPSEQWSIVTAAFDGASVLDIGCNRGGMRNALNAKHRGIRYTGIDGDSEVIAAARREHPDAEFLAEFFPTPALDGRRFDSVFLFGTFYHVPEWKGFLRQLANHATRYIAIDLSMTWDFPTACDPEISYQYYFDSGRRVPRTVINVLDFVNYCFTEHIGAAKVEFMGTRPHTDGAMTAVPLDKQLRGVAVVELDTTGRPLLGGVTPENDPEIVAKLDPTKFRLPDASMIIDGVKTQIYPRPARR